MRQGYTEWHLTFCFRLSCRCEKECQKEKDREASDASQTAYRFELQPHWYWPPEGNETISNSFIVHPNSILILKMWLARLFNPINLINRVLCVCLSCLKYHSRSFTDSNSVDKSIALGILISSRILLTHTCEREIRYETQCVSGPCFEAHLRLAW